MGTDPFEIQMFVNKKPFPSLEAGFLSLAKDIDLHRTAANQVFKKELKKWLDEVADILAAANSGGYPGGTGPNSLAKRSGKAAASIKKSVYVKGSSLDNTEGGIGGLSRLAPHEFGAVIRGKGKHLTIPLKDALKSDGTPKRFSIREWGSFQSKSAGKGEKKQRSDKTLHTLRTSAGNLLVYRRVGRRTEYLYLIIMPKTKGVKIPARLGMGRTLQSRMNILSDRIAAQLQVAMFSQAAKEITESK